MSRTLQTDPKSTATVRTTLLDAERHWWRATEAALTLGEYDLVRELCSAMRAERPNHLDALYYEARLATVQRDIGRAQPLLERVLRRDPEHWPARWAFGGLLLLRGESGLGLACCREAAQGGTDGRSLSKRPAEVQHVWDRALARVEEVLVPTVPDPESGDDPLFSMLRAVLLLEQWWQAEAYDRAIRLARELLSQFPHLVKPRLFLAEWLAAEGKLVESTTVLHEARAADPGGRVARRLGYPALTAAYATPIPAGVITLLQTLPPSIHHAVREGAVWQAPVAFQLPRTTMKRMPQDRGPSPQLLDIQHELGKIQVQVERHLPSKNGQELATAELIVAARQPLVRLYGEEATQALLDRLAMLTDAISESSSLNAHLVLIDDPDSLEPWELEPVEAVNAATCKTTVDQLDERMTEEGERLAYVLLIGGHEIIPHHRLPNPVDDHDMDVPSDNPYAARGDNYLIPTRAVGRLPHEQGSPDLLLDQIERLRTLWREHALSSKGLVSDLLTTLLHWMPHSHALPAGESFGFSAQVWARAAEAVFRTLDGQTPLALCPPTTTDQWESEPLPSLPFYYFNLHGVEDNASWYGQVDPALSDGSEPFPVALTPAQLGSRVLERSIIFTEACYGANPYVADSANSIALAAMKRGCSLFVGSTNTTYASFAPPLLAADLLAALFWRAIAEGSPGGVALQQAKIQLAEATMKRTGYLDVEEQKALTSFILYGDPAFPLLHRPRHANPQALQELAAKTAKQSLYQISTKGLPAEPPDPEVLKAVKTFARPYLQGTRHTLTLRTHTLSVTESAPRLNQRRGQPRPKQIPGSRDRWHVTVSSSDEHAGIVHRRVLTMTVDKKGKVLRSHMSK
ncbi:MAG: C25 family cysteine peptidase [Chloroflexota bacterium]|nr:C25 family cysteine peptidase [Chloroflexota bacterium]